jgi:hypothetical protein
MVYTDLPFFLAVAALGWGLSLATYRWFATRYDWPMGNWHKNRPALPILIGILAISGAILFALARGYSNVPGAAYAGWSIAGFGLLLFLVWTGFLRVASQVSLILAPVAATLLVVTWFGGPDALEYQTVRSEIRELRQSLEDSGAISQPRRDDAAGAGTGTGQPRR